jgi:hypothetical protein
MLSISFSYLLFFVPLLAVISLVYGATRHEEMSAILRHAAHTAYWIVAFMGTIFLAIWAMSQFI